MKISVGAADRFVSQPDKNVSAVLLYGPDQGLVKERAEALGRTVVTDLSDPFNVIELTGAVLKDDPARLPDEANALSFGGGRRFIRLRGAGDAVAKIIEAYVNDPSPDALVVVEAEELGPRSSLRSLFEAHAATAAVACYPAEGMDLLRTSEQMLKAHGVAIEKDALSLLGQVLGADRAMIRREIDKLALYVGENNRASVDDVEACLVSSGEVSLDHIAFCAADGNAADADNNYQRALKEGVSEIAVLRAMQRHFQRLDWAVSQVNAGSSTSSAIGGLRPPVFFKLKDRFEKQVRKWSPDRVQHALSILTEAEVACKGTGTPVELVCGRAVMALSRMG